MGVNMSWGDIPNWAYDTSRSLMQGLYAVDPGTYHHCCRVGEMSRMLAVASGMNEYEQKAAEFAGLFHDIGKMGIDPEIISKPGKLDPREIDVMKTHSVISENIVRPLANHDFFKEILPAIRGHHERVDGEGYPDKLLGDSIPLVARIILVVDTYDAMSKTRAYRKGLPDDIIFAELRRCSGTQFDPQLVQIFLQAHKTWNADEIVEQSQSLLFRKVA